MSDTQALQWPKGMNHKHKYVVCVRDSRKQNRLDNIWASGSLAVASNKREDARRLPMCPWHVLSVESVVDVAKESGLNVPVPPK